MCSIIGIKKDKNGVERALEMLSILKHRGPDGCGLLIDDKAFTAPTLTELRSRVKGKRGEIVLGHNRLAIVGTALQPIQNREKTLSIVCNGEIFNWKELKKGIGAKKFTTDTDSEVILRLVEQDLDKGFEKAVKNAVKELDGEYSFAIKHGDEVLLARDPYGVKPLWVSDNAFASERKALWRIGITDIKAQEPRSIIKF